MYERTIRTVSLAVVSRCEMSWANSYRCGRSYSVGLYAWSVECTVPRGGGVAANVVYVFTFSVLSLCRSHVPVFARPGESSTWSFKTSPVLPGRSNEQELWPSSLVCQWSAMDRNSVIALYLLHRRRKRGRKSFHWVHPIIQKREKFGAFYALFGELRDDANKFFFKIIFECLFHLSTRCTAVWRRVFGVVIVKWGTAFNL